VSVLIPVYNVERFLRQCLDSVLGQTLADIEVIAVDDGSTDGSAAILAEYAARDPRLRVVSKANSGYGDSLNRALDAATGEYVSIVEPDDWCDADMYERMLGLGRGADVIKTPYWRVTSSNTTNERPFNCPYRHGHRTSAALAVADFPDLLRYHPSIWSAVYRRRFLGDRQISFQPIPGAGWADNVFLIKTLCQAERIAWLDEPFYHYREETPEQQAAAMRRDPCLPITRWNEMTDELDALGVTDPGVRRAHQRRAFSYLGTLTRAVDWREPGLLAAIAALLGRLDERQVMADPALSPARKRWYREVLGLPPERINPLP
jgi:hypothetical protein